MSRIIVRRNIRTEKERFNKFLFDQDYLERWAHLRSSILQLYPDLDDRLAGAETNSDREDNVDAFVEEQYDLHRTSLEGILQKFKSLFEDKGEAILDGLSKVMEYDFPEKAYSVYPSLLPGSTYGQRGFAFLSVVNELKGREPAPYIDIVVHELSHVVWNKKIRRVYEKAGLKFDPKRHNPNQCFWPLRGNKGYLINEVAHEDLKEIFAPIVIRCEEFDEIRDSERLKYANKIQQLLTVEYNGQTDDLVNFLDRIFNIERSRGTSFDEIMGISTRIIYSIQDELVRKRVMVKSTKDDDQFEDKLKQQGYTLPIRINDIPGANLSKIFS